MRWQRSSLASAFVVTVVALAAGPTSKPAGPAAEYRQRFAIAGKLEVTAVSVEDRSAEDGGTLVTMTCRMAAAGQYAFQFDAWAADGQPRTLSVAWPAASTRFASVRPGSIHGGPPPVAARHPPTLARDAHDASVVTVRWSYGTSAGPDGRYGYTLAKASFAEPAAR